MKEITKDVIKTVAMIGMITGAALIASTISDNDGEPDKRDWPMPDLKEDYKPTKIIKGE